MRFAAKPCANKPRDLMAELNAAYARNDMTLAQTVLDAIYASFDAAAAAMANTSDGATA